ncbi:MAG: zf-TFIIB domain-containing protein [Sedimentisphaerales bacterium]|nr:zf-TFIIB domain-containing protein [Sedimentisphaerales bacterium]
MKCPACNRQLRQMDVGGIVVDVCENGCGGIWFDNYELEKVDEKHESAGEKLLDIPKDPDVVVDHTAQRLCPKCGSQPMLKHFMSVKHEVEVDECPACRGFWLDCGELGQIRAQYGTKEDRQRAADQYFDEVFGDELARMTQENEEKLARARRIAHMFRFICPTYYIPGKQWCGAF